MKDDRVYVSISFRVMIKKRERERRKYIVTTPRFKSTIFIFSINIGGGEEEKLQLAANEFSLSVTIITHVPRTRAHSHACSVFHRAN